MNNINNNPGGRRALCASLSFFLYPGRQEGSMRLIVSPYIHQGGIYTTVHPGYTTVGRHVHHCTPWVYHRRETYTPGTHTEVYPWYTLRDAPWCIYHRCTPLGRHPGGYTPLYTPREAPWWGIYTVIHPREAPWWCTPLLYTLGRHPGGYTTL